ncbi:MAG: acetyl-CoA carboxylase biotin carboxyl carrier protein subunit [Thermoanaerobaculales bacterium]
MSEPENFKTLVVDDTAYPTRYTSKFAGRKVYVPGNTREVAARLPGTIQRIYATRGQRVKRGDPLLVLEAMKMANDVAAPRDGVIKAVRVEVGEMVAKGQVLVEFE